MSDKKDLVVHKPLTPARKGDYFNDWERDVICEYVIREFSNGVSIISSCKDCDIDPDTFYQWINNKFPARLEEYRQAKIQELELSYHKILDVERRAALSMKDPDWLHPSAAATILNSIGWRLEKLMRNIYGDKVKDKGDESKYAEMLLERKNSAMLLLQARKASKTKKGDA